MFETYNSSGYDLYQPFPDLDQWVIDDKNTQAYHGTLKEVVKYMVQKLDFDFYDVEDGLMLLADIPFHNNIHFGMFKSPIFTSKKEVSHEQAS